jgi:hypothetical protein
MMEQAKIFISFKTLRQHLGPILYVVYLDRMLGGYCKKDNSIFLNLPALFEYAEAKKRDPLKMLCYVLTHEEVHHWIEAEEDHLTSIKFDNIARKMMREQI